MNKSLGDWSDGGTPGNIPNPVVKPVSADGTWRATSWESRSLPRGFSFNISHTLFIFVRIVYNNFAGSVDGHVCSVRILQKRSVKRTV